MIKKTQEVFERSLNQAVHVNTTLWCKPENIGDARAMKICQGEQHTGNICSAGFQSYFCLTFPHYAPIPLFNGMHILCKLEVQNLFVCVEDSHS